jgi:glutamyl-Q tRNA(Asp) synthetase
MRTLESCGLHWDEEPVWQSRRLPAYEDALRTLAADGRLYPCDCSRKDVAGPYPGTCRGRVDVGHPQSLRFLLSPVEAELRFHDLWQGAKSYCPRALGDPIIQRRDGLIAYQLAVVVDDGWQGITDVVRGGDLLDSTPWQLGLQTALGLPHPRYAHTPLITEPDGQKLAKSRRSVSLDRTSPGNSVHKGLTLLGQLPPPELRHAEAHEVIAWALERWRPEVLKSRTDVAVADQDLGSEPRL